MNDEATNEEHDQISHRLQVCKRVYHHRDSRLQNGPCQAQ